MTEGGRVSQRADFRSLGLLSESQLLSSFPFLLAGFATLPFHSFPLSPPPHAPPFTSLFTNLI